MPNGVGIYIRQISQARHGTPIEAAARAADHGVRWVSIMTVWQEAIATKTKVCNKPDSSRYAEYVQAFTEAYINVWLWGYPWQGKEARFAVEVDRAIVQVPGLIRGVMLDPEKGYKWYDKQGEKKARVSADRLVTNTLDLLDESTDIGVTSYGQPKIHGNFPWKNLVAGFGSPQFYTVGRKAIENGVKQWRELGFTSIVPSVPAYGPRTVDPGIEEYVGYFDDLDVDGVIFWSWRQLTREKWKAVERCAKKF
jgi:hypothetical protein